MATSLNDPDINRDCGAAIWTENLNVTRRSYCASFLVNPTVAMDLISIKAPTGMTCRIRAIIFDTPGLQQAAGIVTVQGGFSNELGSGGSVVTPKTVGAGDQDPASTATVHVGDTTVAADFVAVADYHPYVGASKQTYAPYSSGNLPNIKSPTIKDGVTNAQCLVIRHPGATGAEGFGGRIYWTEENS